jgi:hypothetical protein
MAKRRRRIKPVGDPIRVEGADEMARALRDAGVETRRQVRNANQKIGKRFEGWAKTEARAGSRMQSAASRAILGGSTNDYAFVRITRSNKVPFALAAFWGVKGRRGWYAAERYRSSGKDQFPAWVGTGWKWGGTGGPYAINDTIRKRTDDVVDIYRDSIEEAFRDADLPLD